MIHRRGESGEHRNHLQAQMAHVLNVYASLQRLVSCNTDGTSEHHQKVGILDLQMIPMASTSLLPMDSFQQTGRFQLRSQIGTPAGWRVLVLGGYDLASIDGAFSNFPVAITADASQRHAHLDYHHHAGSSPFLWQKLHGC